MSFSLLQRSVALVVFTNAGGKVSSLGYTLKQKTRGNKQ